MKAAAFDLDDTLLRDDLSISPYTLEVFRRLADRGFFFIADSGRTQFSMKPHVEKIGCVSLYIACNGAEIYDGATHELLHAENYSMEMAHEIADFAAEYDAYAQAYDGAHFYFNQYSVYTERYARTSSLSGVYVGDLRKFIKEPRNKILMMAEPEQIAVMLEAARKRFDGRVSITCSKPWLMEFNPLRATKGIALEFAAQHLGITVGDIAAFGDSLNDIPMLTAAGRSVAVANAWKEVREISDEVCGSNNEDGVARWLAAKLLPGEVIQ